MNKIIALDNKKHSKLGWIKPDNYMFTSKSNSVALTTYELKNAMMTFPIAFIESNRTFSPIAILGLKKGENLFIDEYGTWLLGYIPVLFRTYPIILIPQKDGKSGLGFIEDTDLIGDHENMTPFFSQDGELSNELKEIVAQGSQSHSATFDSFQIGEALKKYELCEEWPLVANLNDEKIEIAGLWRINQKVFKSLDPNALYELNNLNALTVIYSQLLSMQNFLLFQKLIKYKIMRTNRNLKLKQETEDQSIDLGFLNDGDSISFDNLE